MLLLVSRLLETVLGGYMNRIMEVYVENGG